MYIQKYHHEIVYNNFAIFHTLFREESIYSKNNIHSPIESTDSKIN